MEFAPSARSTLGVEWELAIVDPGSGSMVPRAKELLADLGDPRFDKEFLRAMIELITGVHRTTDAALDELRAMRDLACAAADRAGLALIGAGTHPDAPWAEQEQGDDPRYARVIAKAGDWGRRLVIFGVHTHIGVEDRHKAIPLQRAALDRLGLLLALSASSPFWQGDDTGFASHRTLLFRQLPTGGLPPVLRDWDEYARAIDDMLAGAVIEDHGELRWDVRPSPSLGTLEVRIADGAPSLDDLAGVSALTHCLLEEASRELDERGSLQHLPIWFVTENKWRAARDGLDAMLIVDADGTQQRAVDAIAEAVERLAPIARDLGAERSLGTVPRILASGGSAARQRRAFEAGGMPAVLDHLRESLRA